jgi:hypothetical protein
MTTFDRFLYLKQLINSSLATEEQLQEYQTLKNKPEISRQLSVYNFSLLSNELALSNWTLKQKLSHIIDVYGYVSKYIKEMLDCIEEGKEIKGDSILIHYEGRYFLTQALGQYVINGLI